MVKGLGLEHFRYREVTPEILAMMRALRSQGKSYYKIADISDVNYSTVVYHLNSGQRQKTLNRARKSLAKNNRKPKSPEKKQYDEEYYKDRYHSDPEFRMKVIRANSGGHFKEDI